MQGRVRVLCTLVALAALWLAAGCRAEGGGYPAKAIDMIVAFPPGGATDVVARALGEYVARKWGQPINVINKPGAAGAPGTLEVIQAKPDGYTLLMHVTSPGVLNPALRADLPYKWDQVTFIAQVNSNPLVFIVTADSPWKTLKAVVEEVKKDPTKFKYGAADPGAVSVFGVALIMQQGGVDVAKLAKVVLGGGGPTVTAVAGGHVDFAAQNLSEVTGLVRGGKLRALAISSEARVAALPDVPTAKEAGFDEFTLQGWNGVVGPPNTPKAVMDRWNEVVKEALADKAFAQKLEGLGVIAAYLGPDAFKAKIQKDYENAIAIAQKLGLRK